MRMFSQNPRSSLVSCFGSICTSGTDKIPAGTMDGGQAGPTSHRESFFVDTGFRFYFVLTRFGTAGVVLCPVPAVQDRIPAGTRQQVGPRAYESRARTVSRKCFVQVVQFFCLPGCPTTAAAVGREDGCPKETGAA